MDHGQWSDLRAALAWQYGYLYADNINDIIEDENGDYITIGESMMTASCGFNLFVLKLDQNLDTIYTRYYGDNTLNYLKFDELHRKGNIYYTYGGGGLWANFGPVDGLLIKTNNQFKFDCSKYNQTTNIADLPSYDEDSSYVVNYSVYNLPLIDTSYEMATNVFSYTNCTGGYLNIEKSKTNEFEVFPNPTNDLVYLEFDSKTNEPVSIIIYDVFGKVYDQLTVTGPKVTLDLSSLTTGTYIVKTVSENISTAKRLVKQ